MLIMVVKTGSAGDSHSKKGALLGSRKDDQGRHNPQRRLIKASVRV